MELHVNACNLICLCLCNYVLCNNLEGGVFYQKILEGCKLEGECGAGDIRHFLLLWNKIKIVVNDTWKSFYIIIILYVGFAFWLLFKQKLKSFGYCYYQLLLLLWVGDWYIKFLFTFLFLAKYSAWDRSASIHLGCMSKSNWHNI